MVAFDQLPLKPSLRPNNKSAKTSQSQPEKRKRRSSLSADAAAMFYQQHEYQRWLIRMGLSADADTGVSRTGLYTDFT